MEKPDADGGKIGAGVYLWAHPDNAVAEPVLITKIAWGCKSLRTDFRPPSAGPHVPSKTERMSNKFESIEEREKKIAATGRYYWLMIEHPFWPW